MVPEVLSHINRLERVLISRMILYKKITIIVKDRFSKHKGTICAI